MRAKDIHPGKLYVNKRGDEFRYWLSDSLYMGCDHRLPGKDIQYLLIHGSYLGDKDHEHEAPNFPCVFRTFKTWASREATEEEYAQCQPIIDKALQKLKKQVEINCQQRREDSQKLEQLLLQNFPTEKLESELKRRKSI